MISHVPSVDWSLSTDDLEVAVALRVERFEARSDVLLFVAGGDKHGDHPAFLYARSQSAEPEPQYIRSGQDKEMQRPDSEDCLHNMHREQMHRQSMLNLQQKKSVK